jgi:3-methyladenine DNA glycosylase AlkD
MQQYTKRLQQYFEQHRNEENAVPMKKYMKDHFPFLGIRTPERNMLIRSFIKDYGIPSFDIIEEIWNLEEREYQYVALFLLEKHIKKSDEEAIDFYEKLVVSKSWWDSVDTLATRIIGVHLARYPHLIEAYTTKWIKSDNMWLNRTAILFQLKYKQQTDVYRLFAYINICAHSKEFFIQKAIGWALREYAKTDQKQVIQFVTENKLAPLSKREALKHIT